MAYLNKHLRLNFSLTLIVLCAALFFMVGPAMADCERGDLDVRFCDEDGDLVADTPEDSGKWLDPSTLVFSYTPVEDPSVYENVFTEFMDYLAEKTGKNVKWYGAESYAAQVEAMRSGRLHVAGISTGPTCFGVNLAGYVPFAIMSGPKGYGYKLQLITQKDSDIMKVSDLKGVDPVTLGGPPECPEREFCLPGLLDVYGLTFADFKPLARLLRMPAFPVMPQVFVGMIAPLPTKYRLYFGEPFRFAGDADDRPDHHPVAENVFARIDREQIRHNAECRQGHDINFRVTEEPEQMQEQDRIPAS